VANQRGQRILPNKNSSSIERVFGLDVSKKALNEDLMKADPYSHMKGKRQINHFGNPGNLICGLYG